MSMEMRMPKVLPLGVSEATFAHALREFAAIVGEQAVLSGDEQLDPYRDAYSLRWNDPDEYLASAVVLPQSVEQVQAVVRIGGKFKIPLYPISTGKNLTYGGAAPTASGSVIVDLKRMNRILQVDEKRAFALVEPGVTYFDLYQHIKDRGLKLWLDVPDPGYGSFIGNALEHGVGYTASPFRDHFGSHCGLEVVLADGTVMRTGMGALPSGESWQECRYAVGPAVDGLFAQSNFGIVTKMGFWLMPQPEAWLTVAVSVPDYTDLGKLIEEVNYLEDSGIMTGRPVYNSSGFHPFEGRFPSAAPRIALEELMADGWPSLEQIKTYVLRHGGPAWKATLQFYGPEEVIRANWEYAFDRLAKAVPGSSYANLEVQPLPLTPEQEKRYRLVDFGIPNMQLFEMTAPEIAAAELHAPVQGHVDFLAVLPRTVEAVHRAQKIIYDTQRAMNAPVTATPFHAPIAWHHRCFLMGAPTIAVYKGDTQQVQKARALYEAYMENMAAAGFAAYRTNPAMQDRLVAQYSFGGHALLRFQERLKDAIDPDGILAPGRYGIWPQRFRKA